MRSLLHTKRKIYKTHQTYPRLQDQILYTIVSKAEKERIEAKQIIEHAEEKRRLALEILDNLGQATFSINQAGEIGENYSAIAADYLNQSNLSGMPFADLILRKNRKALREYYRALHMLFSSNQFDPDLIISMLPSEAEVNNRFFELNYTFVQDGSGYVLSVFVRMKEVTIERELAQREEMEEAILEKMRSNIGGFLSMLDVVGKTFSLFQDFFAENIDKGIKPDDDTINIVMRSLHGSKGLAGQFELVELKETIHSIEDQMISLAEEHIENLATNFTELLQNFEKHFHHATSLRDNLGEEILKIIEGVSFSKDKFKDLFVAIDQGDFKSAKTIIEEKINTNAVKIVDNWERDIQRLASRMGKDVRFEVQIKDELKVPEKLAKRLNVELAHIYRNCIDHGIEEPEVREQNGKDATGKIAIEMNLEKGVFHLTISDDGAGINQTKIAELAKAKSSLDQDQVSKLIEQKKVLNILFLPGFSSSEEVSTLSGRGVGMDAVLNAIKDFNGEVQIESELDKGSSFKIEVPIENNPTLI